jgi:hypothetical protein
MTWHEALPKFKMSYYATMQRLSFPSIKSILEKFWYWQLIELTHKHAMWFEIVSSTLQLVWCIAILNISNFIMFCFSKINVLYRNRSSERINFLANWLIELIRKSKLQSWYCQRLVSLSVLYGKVSYTSTWTFLHLRTCLYSEVRWSFSCLCSEHKDKERKICMEVHV